MASKITTVINTKDRIFANGEEWGLFVRNNAPEDCTLISDLLNQYSTNVTFFSDEIHGNSITKIIYCDNENTYNNFAADYLVIKTQPESLYNFLTNCGYTWESTVQHNIEMP